ncbi:MAG: hypothetical protein ACYS3N_02520 [Planctomycetota bacterium]|jgi:hypothetical protein
MEFLATLSKPSSKVIKKSKNDQVTSEFATSCDNQELVDGTGVEFDKIITDLYKRAEDQCNQFILSIRSEAEYGQAASEFATSFDNQELVDGTETEFDQIISDLFKRAEYQYNQIFSIIRSEAEYDQVTSEFATSYDNQEFIDETEAEFKQIISDLFKRAEDLCNQIISIERDLYSKLTTL